MKKINIFLGIIPILFVLCPYLTHAITVTGAVTYSDTGDPVTNAQLLFTDVGTDISYGGTTDDSGIYTANLFDSGDYSIIIYPVYNDDEAEYFTIDWIDYNSTSNYTISADQSIDFTVDRAQATLTGTVSPNITGGVTLNDGSNYYYDFANASGQYYVRTAAAGEYVINYSVLESADPDGRYYYADDGSTINLSAGANTQDIALSYKSAYITVTVADQNSDPVSGATVNALPTGTNGFLTKETDITGQAVIFLLSDQNYQISVSHNDYLYSGVTYQVNLADEENAFFDFTLNYPDSYIATDLKDADGNIVAISGYVSCSNNDNYFGAYMENGVATVGVLVGENDNLSGQCSLTLSNSEPGSALPVDFTVNKGETINLNFVYIAKDAAIQVNVQDQNGNTLTYSSGGVINLWDQNTELSYSQYIGENEDSIAVTAGTYIASVSFFTGSDYLVLPQNEASVITVASGETAAVNLNVLKTDSEVSGTVIDPTGSSVNNVIVFCSNQQEITNSGDNTADMIETYAYIIDGAYTLSLVQGHAYTCGISMPEEYLSLGWLAPEDQIIDLKAASATIDFQYLEADSSAFGITSSNESVTLNVKSVINMEKVWCWAWSEGGGYSYGEFNFGETYTLPLQSGRVWYLGCDGTDNTNWYSSDAYELNIESAGDYQVDINIKDSNWTVYNSTTVSFDATTPRSIILDDGTTIDIPANAIADSGTVTITAVPQTNFVHTGDQLLAIPWNITATVNGEAVANFSDSVTITLHYTDEALTALGIEEADLIGRYYDEINGIWCLPDNIIQDLENNTIIIETNHFSQYGISYSAVVSEENEEEITIAVPANFAVTERNAKNIAFAWEMVTGANSYNIEVVEVSTGSVLKVVSATDTTAVCEDLLSNEEYQFRIQTIVGANSSIWSAAISARTKPAKPSKLKLDKITSNSALFKWKKNRGSINKYLVRVYTTKGKLFFKKATRKTKLRVINLTSNTKYYYRVKAKHNKDNISVFSKKKYFTTQDE